MRQVLFITPVLVKLEFNALKDIVFCESVDPRLKKGNKSLKSILEACSFALRQF